MEVKMYIEVNAKERFLEWMKSAGIQLGFMSCLERFGIKNAISLKLVNENVFVCMTQNGGRYVLRMQADSKKAQACVDYNNERCNFLIENGVIQKA